MISCYGMSARICSAWKKFRELNGVLVRKQGLFLKQRGEIYECCVRPVLLYCCETWGLPVPDEARLLGVERRMIGSSLGLLVTVFSLDLSVMFFLDF